MTQLENRTFDELKIGDSASLARTLTRRDIDIFAIMSGDINPAHVDEDFARGDMFHKIIAHGMWGASLISAVLGTELPGPGTIYLGQTLRFLHPAAPGDTMTASLTVREKDPAKHRLVLDCRVSNQLGKVVIDGLAEVIAPTEKISRPGVKLPELRIEDHGARHRRLVASGKQYPPIRVAVVHPVDGVSLSGAIEAAEAGLIKPTLIGPPAAIHAAAAIAGLDITGYDILASSDSQTAAAKAVELGVQGEVEALMKGALHTDELLHAVMAHEGGLRIGRRISHVYVMDVPSYPRLLLISDAAVNIYPDLETKRDIVQNAIDLAQAIGIVQPKVALLSAVETVTPKIKSSLEAAELCKMAERGQITGGIVDGPLAFDNAVSATAAKIKGIVSPVAGCADILVVPDLESGNMLAKQLEYLGGADGAGIVLGAAIPIILTSRADSASSRIASCAVAVLLAHQGRKEKA